MLPGAPSYYKNTFDCIQKVLREEGIRAFYQGLTASYLGVIESSLQWVIYERMKKSLSEYKRRKYGLDNYENRARGMYTNYNMASAILL
jgi:Mitochondrial carrier protein